MTDPSTMTDEQLRVAIAELRGEGGPCPGRFTIQEVESEGSELESRSYRCDECGKWVRYEDETEGSHQREIPDYLTDMNAAFELVEEINQWSQDTQTRPGFDLAMRSGKWEASYRKWQDAIGVTWCTSGPADTPQRAICQTYYTWKEQQR